jgi:hypothetical protein
MKLQKVGHIGKTLLWRGLFLSIVPICYLSVTKHNHLIAIPLPNGDMSIAITLHGIPHESKNIATVQ